MKPLHQELKDIRVEKGISLEHISRETKIRVPFLEKIEEGDFTIVPEPFMRAFLREYAETIGLNSDRVISKYEGKSATVRDENFWKYNPSGPAGTASEPLAGAPDEKPEKAKEASKGRKKPWPDKAADPIPTESPSASEHSDVVRAASRIISDSPEERAASETSAAGSGKSLSSIFEEGEKKSSRMFFLVVFVVAIIAATLVILYVNGNLAF